MDTCRNIFPIAFEPVRKLLITAYKSGDFTAADVIIARNTVKQTAMVLKLMNGSMDAYCWSSGRAVAYMLSRTSHPGYMLQLTSGELRLPDGACAVGVEHADLGIEGELAERYGIYITPDAYERFGRCGDAPESCESVQFRVQNSDREISNCER